jgi:hypothetical protein
MLPEPIGSIMISSAKDTDRNNRQVGMQVNPSPANIPIQKVNAFRSKIYNYTGLLGAVFGQLLRNVVLQNKVGKH